MIYQLKVTLKDTKPPVWRRLQVDADTTFHQLHHILQIAFDWDDAHLHMFETANIPEDKRDAFYEKHGLLNAFIPAKERAEIGDPKYNDGWGMFFDEKQEKLSDWLRQENDKITYTYDFGDDWEHIIVLEKNLPPEADIQYPRCVKARHLAPEEDSRSAWLDDEEWSAEHTREKVDPALNKKIQDDINERFRQYGHLLRVQASSPKQNDGETNAHWRALFELADQFKRLQPWQWMSDIDMFAVVDPVSEETGYCCVLGEAGQTYGLAVYIGDEGFRTLIDIFLGNREIYPHQQRSLLLSFNNRSDLTKEDLRLIKELGLTYRGRNAWPVFRSCVPGYVPWYLEEWEVRFFETVLEQVIDVCERVKNDPQLIHSEEGIFARIPKRTDSGIIWMDGSVSDSVEAQEMYATCYVSDTELEHIRQTYPIRERTFECDVDYLPEPVRDSKEERPYFPYLYLCIDTDSGLIMDTQVVPHKDVEANIQNRFIQLIQRIGYIPEAVHVNNEETFLILISLAVELGFELVHAELSTLNQVKNDMFRRFTR